MITTLRRWIARSIATLILVVTLGRVAVQWEGVGAVAGGSDERPAITATTDGTGAEPDFTDDAS